MCLSLSVYVCVCAGFPRFLQGYYIFIITKHKKVGRVLEHHPVYSIEKTALVALYDSGDSALQDTRKEEIRQATPRTHEGGRE